MAVLASLALAGWLAVMAFFDVASLHGSVPMMKIGVLLALGWCIVTGSGMLIVAHHRGELPVRPTPEEDEQDAARFYAEQLRKEHDARAQGRPEDEG